ncbi:MAG: hypothetical protein JNL67_08880 [Planctomycetaceae bacterium]|nr:hypothetical protein [Planctomycetaceae bacterium]
MTKLCDVVEPAKKQRRGRTSDRECLNPDNAAVNQAQAGENPGFGQLSRDKAWLTERLGQGREQLSAMLDGIQTAA